MFTFKTSLASKPRLFFHSFKRRQDNFVVVINMREIERKSKIEITRVNLFLIFKKNFAAFSVNFSLLPNLHVSYILI